MNSREPVSSWGRLDASPHEVIALTDPRGVAQEVSKSAHPGLAFGMGRSYGDACLNPGGTLWRTAALDHFIEFDEQTGDLTCESGVLLGDIQRTFAPRGWMLPVSPGTQFVTVGGAIANDVHGKNHHLRGTFGEHVARLELVRTDGQAIECGPKLRRDWFEATVGGLGLTGVITRATLRLATVPGSWFETETLPFQSIEEFFAHADASESDWEHTVAWIDCLAPRGRGLFFRGRPAAGPDAVSARARRTMPLQPPFSLVNKVTLRAFNAAYFAAQRAAPARKLQHYQTFLYPLDHMAEWNRMYGPRGFFQYQCVVPHADRVGATRSLLQTISASGEGSFLAVLKTFGDRRPCGMLSFPAHGATLALDFANSGDRTLRLFARLDEIVRGCGGRIYPAKDARMPRSLFEAGYPRHADFRAFRDPGISSAMSRRLMGS